MQGQGGPCDHLQENKMITENTVYWITRLDGIKDAVTALGVILSIVFAICIIISAVILFDQHNMKAMKYLILSILLIVLSGVVGFSRTFIPTTKEMCAIKVIPIIANNENVQEIPDKVLKLANEYLDGLLPNTVETEE